MVDYKNIKSFCISLHVVLKNDLLHLFLGEDFPLFLHKYLQLTQNVVYLFFLK